MFIIFRKIPIERPIRSILNLFSEKKKWSKKENHQKLKRFSTETMKNCENVEILLLRWFWVHNHFI